MPDGTIADGSSLVTQVTGKTDHAAAWRRRYLDALQAFAVTRHQADLASVLVTARMLRRIRLTGSLKPCKGEAHAADLLRKHLRLLALQNMGAWATFLVTDLGLDDPRRDEFVQLSPFKGCFLLLLRNDGVPTMRGDVAAYIESFRTILRHEYVYVHRQDFLPERRRKGNYSLLIIRSAPLGRR